MKKYSDFKNEIDFEFCGELMLPDSYFDGKPVKVECFREIKTNIPYQVYEKKYHRRGDPTSAGYPFSHWGRWVLIKDEG